MRRFVLILFAVVAALTSSAGPAAAAPPPLSEGGMSFQAITDVSGPEEFSWTVELGPEQELKLIDDQHAGVFYEDGQPGFVLTARPAHDAEGSNVPTALAVSEGDVITLTVHHRAGNPLAGGAPFVYPIVGGAGWSGGFTTIIIALPLGEFPPPTGCRAPELKGKTLKAAKKLLREANCTFGGFRKRHGATAKAGRVVRQTPAAGAQLTEAWTVQVTLAPPRG
jgi:PASTA domain